jgi:hypothetical protein
MENNQGILTPDYLMKLGLAFYGSLNKDFTVVSSAESISKDNWTSFPNSPKSKRSKEIQRIE